jgi:hypothetical protein
MIRNNIRSKKGSHLAALFQFFMAHAGFRGDGIESGRKYKI